MIWELVGSAAAILTMFGFVPQIIKIYKTRSARDLSMIMLLQVFIGCFLWMLYAYHIQDKILFIANVISTTCYFITIVLYFKYRNRSAESGRSAS